MSLTPYEYDTSFWSIDAEPLLRITTILRALQYIIEQEKKVTPKEPNVINHARTFAINAFA